MVSSLEAVARSLLSPAKETTVTSSLWGLKQWYIFHSSAHRASTRTTPSSKPTTTCVTNQTVDVKGTAVDVKGSTVDVKGSVVD
eukprot:780272-Pyramimonas_sp.AAC.1